MWYLVYDVVKRSCMYSRALLSILLQSMVRHTDTINSTRYLLYGTAGAAAFLFIHLLRTVVRAAATCMVVLLILIIPGTEYDVLLCECPHRFRSSHCPIDPTTFTSPSPSPLHAALEQHSVEGVLGLVFALALGAGRYLATKKRPKTEQNGRGNTEVSAREKES